MHRGLVFIEDVFEVLALFEDLEPLDRKRVRVVVSVFRKVHVIVLEEQDALCLDYLVLLQSYCRVYIKCADLRSEEVELQLLLLNTALLHVLEVLQGECGGDRDRFVPIKCLCEAQLNLCVCKEALEVVFALREEVVHTQAIDVDGDAFFFTVVLRRLLGSLCFAYPTKREVHLFRGIGSWYVF